MATMYPGYQFQAKCTDITGQPFVQLGIFVQGIHPLTRYDNFIYSPHSAWYSVQASIELKRKLAEEIALFLIGEALRYSMN